MHRSERPRQIELPAAFASLSCAAALTSIFAELDDAGAERALGAGRVRLDGHLILAPETPLAAGQVLSLAPPRPRDHDLRPELRLLFRDEQLLVANKPDGLDSGDLPDAVAPLLGPGAPLARLLHRLDKGASGLVVLALSDRAAAQLSEALREHEIRRDYEALVHGDTRARRGACALPLHHQPGANRTTVDLERGKPARTAWRRLDCGEGLLHLALQIETGRTHQIRVHLAQTLGPIVGDTRYGGADEGAESRLYLHASKLGFRHPVTGEEMSLESPTPGAFGARLGSPRGSARSADPRGELRNSAPCPDPDRAS